MSFYYGFMVPNKRVKSVKIILEDHKLLNKTIKITAYASRDPGEAKKQVLSIIPTRNLVTDEETLEGGVSKTEGDFKATLTLLLGSDYPVSLEEDIVGITLITAVPADFSHAGSLNPLYQATHKALSSANSLCREMDTGYLLNLLAPSYNVYRPMLLLPNHVFASQGWVYFLSKLEKQSSARDLFYSTLASEMQVSHIAINAPIPALNGDSSAIENLLRSPTNLTPIYGDFGPSLPSFPLHNPSQEDFNTAFWVSARQNRITQFWAPRYTMFSSGNVTEKARVLQLPSVKAAVQQGEHDSRGCAAVDLFAGIGYFAFSYVKARVKKVLCWDLNPWSVQGLLRGAAANKWDAHLCETSSLNKATVMDDESSHAKLLVFCETNENAGGRIAQLRPELPPIRHVNCGMLPSVGEAWKTAVEALDPELGGWLHLHETAPGDEISARGERFNNMITEHIRQLRSGKIGEEWVIEVEHIERVKSVGPRLWHIVVDIWAGPVKEKLRTIAMITSGDLLCPSQQLD